jgi:hypothetical protein
MLLKNPLQKKVQQKSAWILKVSLYKILPNEILGTIFHKRYFYMCVSGTVRPGKTISTTKCSPSEESLRQAAPLRKFFKTTTTFKLVTSSMFFVWEWGGFWLGSLFARHFGVPRRVEPSGRLEPGDKTTREWILGHQFNKRLEPFIPCYSQSLLLSDFKVNHTLLWF